MTTKKATTKTAKVTPVDPELFPIKDGVKTEQIEFFGQEQQRAVGYQVAQAISEGREFEVRATEGRSAVLLLTSGADDLGHVYLINVHGEVREVGHTEKD